jgi:hypothetical protein
MDEDVKGLLWFFIITIIILCLSRACSEAHQERLLKFKIEQELNNLKRK